MNKNEFIESLRKRLDILEQSEIDDIVSEYSEHIDEKVKSGVSEEKAVKDLGSIDEIVSETLAAYKIKDRYSGNRDATDAIGRAFSQFVGVLAKVLDNISKKNGKDIFKILIEIFLIFLLIMILKIPVEILKGFGSGIFMLLFPPVGNILNFIWVFVIEISYFVIAIVMLFTIIKNRYLTKDEIDEIKRSFSDKDVKVGMSKISDELADNIEEIGEDFKEAAKEIGTEFKVAADEIRKEFTPRKVEEAMRKQKVESERENDNIILGVFDTIAKIFLLLFTIPTFFMMIGFIIAFGFMIVLIVNGIVFIGPFLVIIGLMSFSIFLFELMVKLLQSKRISAGKIIGSIVAAFILIGVGSALTAGEFAFADYTNKAPAGIETNSFEKTYEYEDVPGLLDYYSTKYIIDDEMGTEVKVEVIYYKDFSNPTLVRSSNYINVDIYNNASYKGRKLFKILKNDLQDKTFHNYSLLYKPWVNVYLSQESYDAYREYIESQGRYFHEDNLEYYNDEHIYN